MAADGGTRTPRPHDIRAMLGAPDLATKGAPDLATKGAPEGAP
jgi:hypothetical protein